jgi:predicted Zn-dependent protease
MILRMTILTRLFLIVLLTILPAAAHAQAGMNIIRDAEMEEEIAKWTAPIIRAAGMQPDQINFILVQSDEVNAFVAGGANIFIYTGLIDKTDSPLELLGVIAHELGHITGGHLTRSAALGENLSYEVLLGTILGGAAALLSGEGGALMAGTAAANQTAMAQMLAHSRVQEASADQASITYLKGAGISPGGTLTFLGKLEDQELLPASQQSAYMRTHPVTRERIENLKTRVGSATSADYSPEIGDAYKMIKAKLVGFTKPQQVEWFYPPSDNSMPARYARTIANYRTNKLNDAVKGIDALIAEQPNNPYFYELKGQMLFEGGRVGDAVKPYKTAIDKDPKSGLLRMYYAQALMESAPNSKAAQQEGIEQLKRAILTEDRSPRAHRMLATAYGRIGMEAQTALHLAEEALLQKRYGEAKSNAERALRGLPAGSPDALKAQDILDLAGRAKKD